MISVPGTFDFRRTLSGQRQVFEIVGVAKDVSEDFVAQKQKPAIYFPLRPSDYARPSLRGVTLMARGAPGADVFGAVRREISGIDAALTPFNARTMPEQVEQFMTPLRSATRTYAFIGMFGLALAVVGIAGVTAYSVAQRGHEIGIRMALGAKKGDVLGLVMKEGVILVAAGTAVGLAMAWVGMRVLAGLLSTVATVKVSDPMLIAGAPALLAVLALAACYAPARRSTRIDPVITLRQE